MTVLDVAEILKSAEVDLAYCNLEQDVEGLCLLNDAGERRVFVEERRQRYEERTFDDEHQACVYFLERLFQLWRRKDA